MIRGSAGSISRLAKAAGAVVAVFSREMKNCARLWCEARLQVRMYKTPHSSTTFCCGAKHICKSKCAKHRIDGPLLEVQMSKIGTPLYRQAHLQAKVYKTHHVRTAFLKLS